MNLKIFSTLDYPAPEQAYEPILYPFLGKPHQSKRLKNGCYPWINCFDRYGEIGQSIFEWVPLQQADLAILPVNWAEITEPAMHRFAQDFLRQAQQTGVRTLSFYGSDRSHQALPVHCDVILRNSLYASTRQPHDFALPAWGEDFVDLYHNGQVTVRPKTSQPVVGFCGAIDQGGIKYLTKSALYQVEKQLKLLPGKNYNLGNLLRFKALTALSKSQKIKTNFVLQATPFFNAKDPVQQSQVRGVYHQNMLESDYILCCRGYGNFSFRFYETLSCGRIPILINSDCVLPYDFEIDWKKYCVWIEVDEIAQIADKVAAFHQRLQPEEFIALQHQCRSLWQQYLSPEGFFSHLYRHLLVLNTEQSPELSRT